MFCLLCLHGLLFSHQSFGGAGGGVGRGGGRALTRSPSAIKEMLLNWTKAMTAGYEV